MLLRMTGLLALLLLGATACDNMGKLPLISGGDGGMPADGATEDDSGTLPEPDLDGEESLVLLDSGQDLCDKLCAGRECGPVGECSCGACPEDLACSDGVCVGITDDCLTACQDKECGFVGDCLCGDCEAGEECSDAFLCEPLCTPSCISPESGVAFECGDDGCGGSCGQCEGDFGCIDHACIALPDDCLLGCGEAGLSCGPLPGGDCWCGDCPAGEQCQNGLCGPIPNDCVKACKNLQCGLVGDCNCGSCGPQESCINNKCKCQPSCAGKQCGPDGCGALCGECTYGSCANGQCSCQPQCSGKSCGPNGCGGSCGSCPAGQLCDWNGKCLLNCTPTTVSFSPDVQKLNGMVLPFTGYPGEALDIDANPLTCTPAGKCSDGLNNSLGALFSTVSSFFDVNGQLADSLANGDIVLLAELVGLKLNGTSFSLNMYMAEPEKPKNQCNFQSANCDYLVASQAINWNTCQPHVTFDNAKVVNGLLTAGGLGYQFKMPLPLLGNQPFVVTLFDARIQAKVDTSSAGSVTLSNGVIGGAILKAALLDAVATLPADQFPIDKQLLLSMLGGMIVADIDSDGDGVKESASLGIKFTAIAGAIVGVY